MIPCYMHDVLFINIILSNSDLHESILATHFKKIKYYEKSSKSVKFGSKSTHFDFFSLLRYMYVKIKNFSLRF